MATHKPHPLLKKPVLFIQRVPADTKCDDLLDMLKFPNFVTNATITLMAVSARRAKPGEQVARVEFSDIQTAEKVAALLQSENFPSSPRSIRFSLKEKSPMTLKPRPAVSPCLFDYQISDSGLTRSVIYDVLRLFGPVFSIRLRPEEYGTVSVIFWNQQDADEAVQSLNKWRNDGESVGMQIWPSSRNAQSSGSDATVTAERVTEGGSSTRNSQHLDISTPEPVLVQPEISEPVGHDPCKLFCNLLPPKMGDSGLTLLFERFGDIKSVQVYNLRGRGYAQGSVTFRNREDALHAIDALNGTIVGRRQIVVQLDSQEHTDKTHSDESTDTKHQTKVLEESFDAPEEVDTASHPHAYQESSVPKPDFASSPADSETTLTDLPVRDEDQPPKPSFSEVAAAHATRAPRCPDPADNVRDDGKVAFDKVTAEQLSDYWTQIWKNEAESLRAELAELRVREGKLAEEWAKELKEKQKRKEEMVRNWEEREELMIRNRRLEGDNVRLQQQLDLKTQLEKQDKANADAALQELRRLSGEASALRYREVELEEQVEDLTDELKISRKIQEELESKITDLDKQLMLSESRRKMLELEADRPKWEQARKRREEAEQKEREKTQRREHERNLNEVKKKLQELERKEREERERKKAAEEKRRREEELRKKEEEEKKRRELEEKLRKEKAWKQATETETQRCRDRDRSRWGSLFSMRLWNSNSALSRFKLIMDEFEKTKFSIHTPMTALSIPWPVLDDPIQFDVENVQWDSVEKFFGSVQLMVDTSEYKALVEKSHKMFHPDRWRSRNLLSTVMEENERCTLERAGNIVSQAITPIWRKSRG